MVKLEGDAEPKQRIYGAYTKDFVSFSEPFVYLEDQCHVIDLNIVYDNGWYYRFVKDETNKNIRMDRVKRIGADVESEEIHGEVLDNLFGVEGPETYQLPDSRWCLIVDRFAEGKGYIPLICTDLEKGDFTVADENTFDMGKSRKRHGGVIKITDDEMSNLVMSFGDEQQKNIRRTLRLPKFIANLLNK